MTKASPLPTKPSYVDLSYLQVCACEEKLFNPNWPKISHYSIFHVSIYDVKTWNLGCNHISLLNASRCGS
jgi:hypothetical protein